MLPANSKIDFRADYAATFVTSNMSSQLKIIPLLGTTGPLLKNDVGSHLEMRKKSVFEKVRLFRRL